MKKVSLIDSSLRESGQTYSESFSVRQKLVIARSLDFLGIDAIEVGHPGLSWDIDEFIAEVKGEQLKAELIVHARADERDIEAALKCGINRISVRLGASEIKLPQESGARQVQACRLVSQSVKEVTASGRRASFAVEDAARVNMNVLIELCRAAVDAGAQSISLADTSGKSVPDEIRSIFLCMKSVFPDLSLDSDCHDGLGLAVENSLAAMEGGAESLHVAISRPGEGAGITPLRNLAVALRVHYGIDTVDMPSVHEITRMVSRFSDDLPSHDLNSRTKSFMESQASKGGGFYRVKG
ncbi:MAG: beta/alpha barrel domain-containing protein [Thermoleophilia bacterium]